MSVKKSIANRKFYSLPENPNRVSKSKFSGGSKKREDIVKLVKYIDDNVIGKNSTFIGPYGRRKVVYCDYAASGRSLQFIEDYILREVLPNCGNAHSTTSITSLQSTLFRHEAKELFKLCTNASDNDTIIFAGHGCRGPISKLLQELDLREPPVVFVGPCEQQSALLPWKELGAKMIRISESKEGFLDLDDLGKQLIAHKGCGAQLIGCFSAANNVTGILADDVATTLLLHQHGALAFWDYNVAAPYVQLDMNPTLPGVEESAVQKDVMFFSGHKFIGGIQAPGILIAKKFLFKNSLPKVNSSLSEEKEEGETAFDLPDDRGTATIVEDVRAGLVMHLKEAVGTHAIMSREEKITRTVLAHVKNIPEFVLLGNNSHCLKRLPIFSFIVRHPRGMFLHHNFVCSVLNDVFGIQARGDSADSQDFMGIDVKLAENYEKILLSHLYNKSQDKNDDPGLEILRPGFTKISLPFCINDAELGFILEAVKMVATEGWKLLPQYILKPGTGEWRHHSNSIFRDRKWLGSLKYIDGRLVIPERKISTQGTCPADYEECLHVARCIFNRARKIAQRYPMAAQKFSFDQESEPLRWFMVPTEAHDLLIGNSQNVRHKVPFDPNRYKGCKGGRLDVQPSISEKKVERAESESSESIPGSCVMLKKDLESATESNYFNPAFHFNSNTSVNNRVPNVSHCSLSERQNSFSSELSNSDYVDSLTYQQTHCYPNFNQYTNSPVCNSVDVFCYSPQPSLSSPLPNPVDMCSTQYPNQQINYVPQKTFSNQCSSSSSKSGGVTSENSYNSDFSKEGKIMGNWGVAETNNYYNGKLDPQQPMNKVHFLLSKNDVSTRQRCNSLGSALVFNPRRNSSLGFSCRSLTDGETSLNLSECSLSSNEDIHAYVTEVTKELATEIKSEIREVISKVEDVLSESVDTDGCIPNLEHRGSRCFEKLERTNSLPSASANDIAQYLMGVSKEMAEEMKSEIRGLVNSVVSPESSPMLEKKGKKVTIEPQEKSCKNQVSVVSNESISQSRDSGINLSYSETLTDLKVKDKEVVGKKVELEKENVEVCTERDRSESIDSFQETEVTLRCRSESLDSLQENEDSDAASKSQIPRRKINRIAKKTEKFVSKSRLSEESSNDEELGSEDGPKARWCCPSKAVWKPTVEAVKEFEMIKNGDRILVCLNGGKNCLAMIHALQQYRFYASSRGIHFELGTLSTNPNASTFNSKGLVSYVKNLGLSLHCEDPHTLNSKDEQNLSQTICKECWKMQTQALYDYAQRQNYNVIAFAQTLDDLAETFLFSAFHNGRLTSIKAHHYIKDKNLRVIRPFVYVREKALKQYVESRNLPAVPENCDSCKSTSKERQMSKELLSQQEAVYPRLFNSLKAALHPLMTRDDTNERYASDSDATSLT